MQDKKLVVLLAALVILAALASKIILDGRDSTPANDTTVNAEIDTEVADIQKEYPQLPKSNAVVRESARQTIDRLKSGDGIVFLGFKECPWCQKLLPVVNEAAEAEGVEVYYLDIRQARTENTIEYQELVGILSPYLPKDDNGGVRILVPDVSLVRDGEIVYRHENESVTEDEKTPETYWTKERTKRTIERLRSAIAEMNQSKEENNERI